jgi:hypothetical protein
MKNFSVKANALLVAFIATLFSFSASAQTLTLNEGVIVRSATNRVGVKLGVINDWANGPILKGPNSSPDKTGGNPANTTVLRDDVAAALQNYFGSWSRNNPGILRYSLNGNEGTIGDWTEPDYAHELASSNTGSSSTAGGDEAVSLSLQDFLAICQYLKVEPYLEIPATISAADAANLVEFLAGPSGTPFGSKRAALGQEEPWTTVFSNIHLSFCNECGNALSLPGQASPDLSSQPESEHLSDFSNSVRDIFAAVRAQSYYSASSFDLVMSVPSAFNYSIETAIESAHPDSIEIDDYPHFPMNGLTSNVSLMQATIVEPFERVTSPADPFNFYQSVPTYQSLTSCGASGTAACKVNIYGSSQGATTGSAGAAEGVLVALQSLMNMQYYGIGPQSISTPANYANAAGNGLGAKQKAVAYNSEAAPISLPSTYLGLQLVNQSIIGAMFSCPIANNLTYDFSGSTDGVYSIPALRDVPYLYAFCFENGTRRSLVLINTDPTQTHTLSFGGDNPPSGSVTQRQFAPAALDDKNEAPVEHSSYNLQSAGGIETSTLSSPSSITLPPYSVTALDFTAVSELDFTAADTAASTIASVLSAPASSPASGAGSETQSETTGTPVINCPSGFTTSAGPCSISANAGTAIFFSTNESHGGSALSGTSQVVVPTGCDHCGYTNSVQTPVNVQAFTVAWTFVPNEYNGAIVFQNNTNDDASGAICSGTNCAFTAGAGYEAGFFQAFGSHGSTNYTFALEFYDNHSFQSCTTKTCSGAAYTGSTAQIYQSQQPPYNPNYGTEPWYWTTDKILTSPVQFSSPATTQGTTTGHTYSATLTYDGTTLTYDVYDVTAGGTCTPITSGTCFSQSWANVNIPSIVGSNTAYLGIGGGSNAPSANPYLLNSLVYTVNTPPASQSFSSYTSKSYTGSPFVAAPTFSPVAGTYSGTQKVSVSSSTSGAYFCYTLSATTPTFLPQTDNYGGCTEGTLYSGPVTVPSTQTLYVMGGVDVVAGVNYYLPSNLVTAEYTIGGTQATAPSCSPTSGTSSSPIAVTCTNSNPGTTIMCYTENGTAPTTNGAGTGCTTGMVLSGASSNITISSSIATLNVVAGTSTLSDSTVSSNGAYTIGAVLPTPTFSLPAGIYTGTQSVAISESTAGTTIYYTTNGITPTTSSTVYTGPITVSSTETLQAIAAETGYINSPVDAAGYTISTGSTTYISYPSGGFTSGSLVLNGGATVTTGGLLQLTDGGQNEARSAWFGAEVPVQSFVTDFTFQQLNANADGMTFTIQARGTTALGATGGGLGYQGITPSVAVKFDLFDDNGEGKNSTGLYTDGAAPTTPAVNLSTTGINLHSGDVMNAQLAYDGTNLTMTLTDAVTSAFVTEVFPVNIPSLLGGNLAWVGFTGGTGGETSTENVLSWSYMSSVPPASTPTFSPAAGTYATAQSVSIDDAAAGTTIYYTTNGTTPTIASAKYTGAITVNATETIEAIAVGTGYANSPVATAAYDIVYQAELAAPAPGLGTVLGTTNVDFQWNAGTGATLYELCLSTIAPGGCDLFMYKGAALTVTVPSLPADGVIAYATLSSDVNGAWQQRNYLYTESGTPVPAVLQSPTPGLSTGLGTSNVNFSWNAGTGVTLYQLCLSAIEPGACDLFSYKGTALSATVTSVPANGATVYATLYSNINGAWQQNNYLYTEHGLAMLKFPSPGLITVLGTTNVSFQWSNGGGVAVYQFCLSTVEPGACDLFSYKGTALSVTVASLPADGVTVYATLYSYLSGAWQQKDYVYTESGTPVPAVLQSPTPGLGTVLGATNVGFQWSAGTGVTVYQFCLSIIEPGACDLFSYKGAALSTTVPSLPANVQKVYATLWSDINGAWQQENYLYTESGTPVPAVLQSPTPGLSNVLGTSNVGFQWNAGTGVTLYQFCLSSIAPGGCDLFTYKGTDLSATVPSLPAGDETVYATLWSYIKGAWQQNNYLYTESGSPVPAVLQSPTPGLGTVLGTTSVSFQWNAGSGVSLYQFCLSTIAPGGCDLFTYKGAALSATVLSLPANGTTVYATLWSYINGAWHQNNYLYTEQ